MRNIFVISIFAAGTLVLTLLVTKPSFNVEEMSIAIRSESEKHVIADNDNYVMAYLYNGKQDASYVDYVSKVDAAKGTLDEVAPFYFSLSADGQLNSKNISKEFVDQMHSRNIKVVPFLSDAWDAEKGAAALKNREALASQIADVVTRYQLDGVNVDVEAVTEKDRSQYTEFVKLLRSKLPKEKMITVAVPANPNGWTTGWHGAFDYKELSKHADYLMLMAYDEHFQNHEKPGPVASISFVEKSIQYAFSKNVPPEKLVLGIPFYGRIWNEAGSVNGIHLPLNRVDELVAKYKGTVTYDKKQESAKAVFSIPTGRDPVTLEGTLLPPGKYTLWFDNEQSLKTKLHFVEKYNLKGAGNWSLGLEKAKTWDYYGEAMNGQ